MSILMATSIGNDISNQHDPQVERVAASSAPQSNVLICLPPTDQESRRSATAAAISAFPNSSVSVAVTERDTQDGAAAGAQHVLYEEARSQAGWALHAADYLAAGNLARKHQKTCVILLGSDDPTVELLQGLAFDVTRGNADIVVPRLSPGPNDGLVNSALLYPMTRALFGQDIRFPLPHNIALSQRAMERLAAEAQREVTAGRSDSILWPVSAASALGFSVRQIDSDDRLPTPQVSDFNRLFTEVIGSLLADTETKAVSWQRGRYVAPARQSASVTRAAVSEVPADIVSMIEGFHVAYANLLPIWSLVLPPQSLLALKKLAQVPSGMFSFPPELWARSVYDFALAFHLRTINRNHLLGALTPLYLAWAASHILSAAGSPTEANRLVHETATAFETEKPYFVSRWRWPDRFNP
jgi:hypothetical protein